MVKKRASKYGNLIANSILHPRSKVLKVRNIADVIRKEEAMSSRSDAPTARDVHLKIRQ
jgi:hypothetical protein